MLRCGFHCGKTERTRHSEAGTAWISGHLSPLLTAVGPPDRNLRGGVCLWAYVHAGILNKEEATPQALVWNHLLHKPVWVKVKIKRVRQQNI